MYQLLIITRFMKSGWELEGGSTSIASFSSSEERDRAISNIEVRTDANQNVRITLVKL
ncbi:hypothetical protein Amme3_00044 [Pseudomonas phage vB_PpuM-Amme-3]|uniref:Uncharacterized protein n=1 Tax=Pseudomonas phage vB_PpuM-Amme-3 TaxID=3132617 RepID=A0AAX4MWI8_9CAUD